MKLMHKKSRWQRLLHQGGSAAQAAPQGLVRSGLVTVGTAAAVTVASAVVSAVRHSGEHR